MKGVGHWLSGGIRNYPRACVPDWCSSGDLDLGVTCGTYGSSYGIHCERSCGVRMAQPAFGGSSFLHQSVVTCSNDFTDHAIDNRRVILSSLEWKAPASRRMRVDLWGGGGGGASSAIRTRQTEDIEATIILPTSDPYRAFRSDFRAPTGVYHHDVDAGNVRWISPGDVYHLGPEENCKHVKSGSRCWTLRLTHDVFGKGNSRAYRDRVSSHLIAELDWQADDIPFGNRSWTFFPVYVQHSMNMNMLYSQTPRAGSVELKPAVTSFGVCGGSGGGGSHVHAVVPVKAGHFYRIEAGPGGRGSTGGQSAKNGQSSRLLEKSEDGEWHVLAEASGGFGAGSFDEKLKFSPGGQGGVAPNMRLHSLAADGEQGQPSRSSLRLLDTILSPQALRTLPKRLFNQKLSLRCSNATRPGARYLDRDFYMSDPFPDVQTYFGPSPEVCKALDARRPADNPNGDYFVSCDLRCIGTAWPSSTTGGQLNCG